MTVTHRYDDVVIIMTIPNQKRGSPEEIEVAIEVQAPGSMSSDVERSVAIEGKAHSKAVSDQLKRISFTCDGTEIYSTSDIGELIFISG